MERVKEYRLNGTIVKNVKERRDLEVHMQRLKVAWHIEREPSNACQILGS